MKLTYLAVVFITSILLQEFSYAAQVQNTVETYLHDAIAAGKKSNRLINEASPYLLQHAFNPVQWYPWGEEAFEKARQENKPILISIGYSTCHWCHVMAHESFENQAIADLMNKYVVSIKIDREERPDIDAVYMAATQLINGHGGWPMTVFINHKLEPFHAGTYYPPESIDGRPGFKQLLMTVDRLWNHEREKVDSVARAVTARIRTQSDEAAPTQKLRKDISHFALQKIAENYDEEFGGFSHAPKFPRPGLFAFLLKLAANNDADSKRAKTIMRTTLTSMAQGGLYDQVGGGFHRYSVDAQWQIPHFEKMLYSQALLAMAYIRMHSIDPQPLYEQVVRDTLDFVMREMTSNQGGFYSALDADSERAEIPGEHAEGAYYLWYAQELEQSLTPKQWKLVSSYYAIQPKGNISSDPGGEFGERNILYVNEAYRQKDLTRVQRDRLRQARGALLKLRNLRPRPHLDDKIITAWNGMMINAFAEAYKAFPDKRYLSAATTAAKFIKEHLLQRSTGKLYRRARGTQVGVDAGLGDYAWYINGLIGLYRATEDKDWLQLALSLSRVQHDLFYDKAKGGYFDVGDQDTTLLFRSKTIYDGALPAPGAVAQLNLLALAELSGEKQWQKYADEILNTFAATINLNPVECAMLLANIQPYAEKVH